MNTGMMDNIINYQRNQENDYYFILGCDENSSVEQITAEYKSRVLHCHPDKHPGDEKAHQQFAKLSQAKDTLLDPEKRKDYDKWRHSDIAIPYDTWRSMAHVKTSMHWGYQKPQVAISHSELQPADGSKSVSKSQSEQSKNIQELQDKFRFTPREHQANTSSLKGWQRDTSNPMLQKFRNYQI